MHNFEYICTGIYVCIYNFIICTHFMYNDMMVYAVFYNLVDFNLVDIKTGNIY